MCFRTTRVELQEPGGRRTASVSLHSIQGESETVGTSAMFRNVNYKRLVAKKKLDNTRAGKTKCFIPQLLVWKGLLIQVVRVETV